MAASMDQNVADDEANKQKVFPSFIERYFTARYRTDTAGKSAEDFCILQHSNKICVITLARGHPILRNKMKVDKVDFQVTANTNRMNNKVSGKSKKVSLVVERLAGEGFTVHRVFFLEIMSDLEKDLPNRDVSGAQLVQDASPLCTVHCSNGKSYTVRSCIKGKLVEVNEILLSHPELIVEKPETEGYVAIILLRLSDCDSQLQNLLTEDQYNEVLSSRVGESYCPGAAPVDECDDVGDNEPPT